MKAYFTDIKSVDPSEIIEASYDFNSQEFTVTSTVHERGKAPASKALFVGKKDSFHSCIQELLALGYSSQFWDVQCESKKLELTNT